jgi:hypothetical protein
VSVRIAAFVGCVLLCALPMRGQIQLTGKTVDGRMEELNQKAPDIPPPGFNVSGIT